MRDLPDFENPPLVEVVLGVQFDPLPALRSAHLGLWWQQFRKELPRAEEVPPLPPVVERFGVQTVGPPRARLMISPQAAVNRTWFMSDNGAELVQVQPDRFLHNWRKVASGDKYPRYELIAKDFLGELESFQRFVEGENLGGPFRINQCEIVYVNVIGDPASAPSDWVGHSDPGAIVAALRLPVNESLGPPEDVTLMIRHMIPGNVGRPAGRLTMEFEPTFVGDENRETYRLQLTARGEPIGEGIDGAMRFLELGHRVIVKGFTQITTPKMHKMWRRLQ
ncbi:MAG TPA: TIGR04255 family protein [Thermoanaerobaculia bacterium]